MKFVNYGHKKFYNIDTWSKVADVFLLNVSAENGGGN
jgi:hypothetical protein